MREFGPEFVNEISDKYAKEGWAETTPFLLCLSFEIYLFEIEELPFLTL